MAPKRPQPLMAPKRPQPPASSSEEEESSTASHDEETKEDKEVGRESGESESRSSSDEEKDKGGLERPSQRKLSSPPPPPPPQQQQKSQGGSSSTESESESESEAESESELRRDTVKPIFSKPMENVDTPPAKKQRPEPSLAAPEPSLASKQPSAKRKVNLEGSKEPKESKRGKDVAENGSLRKSGEESNKPMFQRILGDSDEIVLLQGMVEFREKKGMDPFANIGALFSYVKKLVGQEFTDNQLANKIRVLKKKYNTNVGKAEVGEDRFFSKPHEQKVFELSKIIWGADKNGDAGGSGDQTATLKANVAARSKSAATPKVVSAPKPKSETSLERPKENGGLTPSEPRDTLRTLSCDEMLHISGIGFDQDLFKKGWEMVDESSKEEMQERWRKLQLDVMRVLAERATWIVDQTNLVLEAYERSTRK